jgi:cytidyltransferase-like protein
MKEVIVSGAFDDMRFGDFRYLEEASKLGRLRVLLWSDDLLPERKFPQAEREYLLRANRFVADVEIVDRVADLPRIEIPEEVLSQIHPAPPTPTNPLAKNGKKVIATGCYDWFHSGHVRFFEECSELGDLYVTVGNDETVTMLKGKGHPLFPATQRRAIVASVRFVTQAIISTGMGWLDAEPEIDKIRPDIYAVNEDGDKPEKREFCAKRGIEYIVLRRAPREGLPRRNSTTLRGF